MTLVVPTRYVQPDVLAWSGGRPIRDVEWLEQLGRMHHLYARQGATVPLWEAEQAFETTSVTPTQTNDGPGEDLSRTQGAMKLVRPGEDSSAVAYYVEAAAYLEDADLLIDVIEYETGATLATLTLSATTPAMVRNAVIIDLASASRGGLAGSPTRTLVLVPRVQATGALGRLLHAHAREGVLVAAQVPVRRRDVFDPEALASPFLGYWDAASGGLADGATTPTFPRSSPTGITFTASGGQSHPYDAATQTIDIGSVIGSWLGTTDGTDWDLMHDVGGSFAFRAIVSSSAAQRRILNFQGSGGLNVGARITIQGGATGSMRLEVWSSSSAEQKWIDAIAPGVLTPGMVRGFASWDATGAELWVDGAQVETDGALAVPVTGVRNANYRVGSPFDTGIGQFLAWGDRITDPASIAAIFAELGV